MSMEMVTLTTRAAVPVDALVEAHRPLVDAARPAPIRLRVAKGLLPATIEDLLPTVAFLTHAPEPEIAEAARETLRTMPENEVVGIARGKLHAAVLDTMAHVLPGPHPAQVEITVNRFTADATLIYLAGAGDGRVCDQIARNSVRCLGEPAIIEALYFNPKAPSGQLHNLIEFAVREGLDLDHIPGYAETRAAILGERGAEDDGKGLSDIEFLTAMAMAVGKEGLSREEQERLELGEDLLAQAEDEHDTTSLQSLILRMSVSQKIRLSLVGDANARKLLIRDPKKMVALAVLKSPRLTDGEVRMFAQNKALAEEILTQICRNRTWTRDYGIRKALVLNPKTPMPLAMGFLRTLVAKDIKEVSKSRDVSGVVARAAKRILDQAELARKGKR